MRLSRVLVILVCLCVTLPAFSQGGISVPIPPSGISTESQTTPRQPTEAEKAEARENEEVPIGVMPGSFTVPRNGLPNCRQKFTTEKKGRVAFIGGSITVATGWRDRTCEFLKRTYPETEFDFVNAGIGGTNSTYGAFRLEQDVFKNGPVDLLFIEFAVNDAGNLGPDNRRCRAIEGIVRRARRLNPAIDILIMYFADKGKVGYIKKGNKLDVVFDHEEVAEHYGIPSLDLSQEVAARLAAKEFRWDEFSSDTCHPTPFGHAVYGRAIEAVLRRLWTRSLADNPTVTPHKEVAPMDPLNYENGRFIPLDAARLVNGWNRVKEWDTEKKCNYDGVVDVLAADAPGATLELDFEGTLVGIDAIAGMDAGILRCSVDDAPVTKVDLFDQYCKQFHRPVCRVLAENLPPGKHMLRVIVAPDRNGNSEGTAARIRRFVAN